jgi:lipid II:glycine glycyltransferase (peptidoglycan interpeptide bridge formation enzyme)
MDSRPVDDAGTWDAAVAAANGHLLQTWGWGELKGRFGWSPRRLAVEDGGCLIAGAQVLYRSLGPLQLAYVPRGPWGDLSVGSVQAVLAGVHALDRRQRAILLKVEAPLPDCDAARGLLAGWGFRPSAQRVQPSATILVSLAGDLAAVSTRFKPKWRYNIGLATRRGVTVRVGGPEDVAAWYLLMTVTGRRDAFGIHPESYYRQFFELMGKRACLLLAEHEGRLLAGIAVTAFGRQAIYMYGASGDEERNLMPNHLLQWEAMKWAKDLGCSEYDLWGIPDDAGQTASQGEESAQPDAAASELAGVYRFKAGFGGDVVRSVGAWDYTYSRPLYWLYNNALPWYRRLRSRGRQGAG